MTKFIVGAKSDRIYEALHHAGVFQEPPENVRRIVIDLQAGAAARFYIDAFVDSKLTDVLLDAGIQLVSDVEET